MSLAVFNLIPIPPLDGSKVLAAVLPYKAYNKYMRYEQYIMIALMILLFVGALDGVISTLSTAMMKFISIIPGANLFEVIWKQPSYKLEIFEGPMDLLLHLISKHKLNI
mgnify:CR=1 FL=1